MFDGASWSTRLFRQGDRNDPTLPDRLEDRSGQVWSLAEVGLSLRLTRELFADPAVPVLVQQVVWPRHFWLDPPRRERDLTRLSDRLVDGGAWQPSYGEHGLWVEAQLWRHGSDRLLVLDDHFPWDDPTAISTVRNADIIARHHSGDPPAST